MTISFKTVIGTLALAAFLGGTLLSSAQPAFDDGARHVVEAHAPSYDYGMWLANLEGTFVVAVTVLPSGVVHNARLLDSAFVPIDSEIVAFAKRWKFEASEPTTMHKIEFVFELAPEEASDDEIGTAFVAPNSVVIRVKKFAGISTGRHPRPQVR